MRSVKKSLNLFQRACNVIPGGAQTFSKSSIQHIPGVSPLFLSRGKGSKVWDVDGNEYIDYIQGLLPNILGYANDEVNKAYLEQIEMGHSFSLAHPKEVILAEKLQEIIPCAEMVRFGKNGSDATTGAIRIARAFTKRNRIACCGYHGWHDWFIGSTSRRCGVPVCVQELTHPFPYNRPDDLEKILNLYPKEFAAVILEPVNFEEPKPGYLNKIQEITKKHGALLIFDEVCTGFHFGLGGAQKHYGVIPDLACFGKAMGNGFPISALVGKKDIMKKMTEIFFSFTFAGDIAAISAAIKVIEILEKTDVLFQMQKLGAFLKKELNNIIAKEKMQERIRCRGFPSWSQIQFLNEKGETDLILRSLFQQEVVKKGILILTTHNISGALNEHDINKTLKVYTETIKQIAKWISDKNPKKYLEGPAIQQVFKVR